MNESIITVKEAIKQGYKYAILNDDESCTYLEELTCKNFKNNEVHLMEKEPSYNVINNGSIIDLLINKHIDDPTELFNEDHLNEPFIEEIEDILRDDEVLKAEAKLCEAIKNATKKANRGCYQPSPLSLVFSK